MKKFIVLTLMVLSANVYADVDAIQKDEWEGASQEVMAQPTNSQQTVAYESDALDLSHPWHYGRQDSDALVGRSRFDEHHD